MFWVRHPPQQVIEASREAAMRGIDFVGFTRSFIQQVRPVVASLCSSS
jgi:hypothetical protein